VDRLARKGYVERYRSDEDRRQVLVRMTTEGAKRTMKLYGPLVDEGQQQLAGVSDRQLRLMHRYLEAITELTDRHRDRVENER
jgi:DNA-binding MarR family transcriptional regulator